MILELELIADNYFLEDRHGIDPWKNNMSSFLGFFIEM